MKTARPELPGKSDMPMAFRAIALAENLSGDAKRIAAIIIAHFNIKTGQCDPGTERLMSKAKVSKRTVVNVTNELDRVGLVVKVRHGGNGFRSRYQPNWGRFREIVKASEDDEKTAEIVQVGALRQCKSVHLDSANPCTLTQSRNSIQKLKCTDGASGRVQSDHRQDQPASANEERIAGLLRDSLRRPSPKKTIPLSVVDAQEAARTEIDTQIENLSDTMREIVLERLTPEIQNEAIIAEQKTRGAGLRLVVDRVSRHGAGAGVR